MTLDFNDIAPLPDHNRRTLSDAEREELRADLLARLEFVLFTLFPAGKKRRGKFLIGDVLGSPGDSLEVVLDGDKQGLWTDRATGDGGDIYALNHSIFPALVLIALARMACWAGVSCVVVICCSLGWLMTM